jgi:hypothetical protein
MIYLDEQPEVKPGHETTPSPFDFSPFGRLNA